MIVVPIANSFKEEMECLRSSVKRIEASMPKKSKTQEELDTLRDIVTAQEEVIKKLKNESYNLLSLNERLIEYIGNIDAIKNAGGIQTVRAIDCVTDPFKTAQITKITIPQVTLAYFEYK